MMQTLAIARRELDEKKFILTTALVGVCVLLVVPFLRHVKMDRWREIYVVGSAVIGVLLATALALILGASIVGREITDRRLSFYFTKPVSAAAIWFGKVIGALLLIGAAFFISMIPAFVAGRAAIHSVWSGGAVDFYTEAAVVVVALFFLGHVFGTVARSRSSWAFVDLAAIALLAYAVWWIAQPLLAQGATTTLLFAGKILGWLLLIAVAGAGAWQLSRGRTDRLQSHRALSQFLWPAAVAAVAMCGAYVAWIVTSSPDDLTGEFAVRVAPRGDYAFVSGVAHHRGDYRPVFLMNVRDGAFTRVDGVPLRGGFSADGRRALLVRPTRRSGQIIFGDVVVRDLAIDGREEPADLTLNTMTWPVAVSPDGNRVGYGAGNTLAFYDLTSKRSLGSMRIPDGTLQSAWFASNDVLRIYTANPDAGRQSIPRTLEICEYDIRSRTYVKTGFYTQIDHMLYFSASADGSRLFVRATNGVVMIDARTGAVLQHFPGVRGMVMMPDGRLVGIGSTLRVFNGTGLVERELPARGDVWAVRPLAADKVLIGTKSQGQGVHAWRLSLIDVNTGSVLRSERDLQPLFIEQPLADARRAVMNPEQLFIDAKGNLIRWNPLTNDKNVVISAKG